MMNNRKGNDEKKHRDTGANRSTEVEERFKSVFTDPKFAKMPRDVKKVQVKDDRFASMKYDKRFTNETGVDERGFKTKSKKANNELNKYYDFEEEKQQYSDDEEEVEEEEEEIEEDEDQDIEGEEEEGEAMEDDDSDTSAEFEEYLNKYQQDALNEEDVWENAEPGNPENIPTGEETSRLSVQNLDWDTIHAKDLFILFSSFCKGGESRILKVEIYPSQYGIEEMEKEKTLGPDREIFSKTRRETPKVVHTLDDVLEEEKEEEFDGLNQAKLRKYELKKLKYYFAIVYCDSVETAANIYNECDGMEVERTQCFLDLRFVPDSIKDFPNKVKEMCDSPDQDYAPNFQANRALNHSKVKLTWDTNDQKREDTISKAFKKGQLKEEEIEQYIVSSDSEDEEDAKALNDYFTKEKSATEDFQLLKKKRKTDAFNIKEGQEIEITFSRGLENLTTDASSKSKKNAPREGFMTKDVKPEESKWDQFKTKKKEKKSLLKEEQRKKREKVKKQRRGEFSESEEESDSESQSVEEVKKNVATKEELDLLFDKNTANEFVFNPKDRRFGAVYKDTNFAIDPTDSNYKRNKKIVEASKKGKGKNDKKGY